MADGASEDTAEIPVVAASVAEPAAAPASHQRRTRRRRWPWITVAVVVAAVVLVAGGAVWYVSGLIGDGIRVSQPDRGFPLRIVHADGTTIGYSPATGEEPDQGVMGLATVEGGYVQTGPGGPGTGQGTRKVTAQVLPPTPAAGESAVLDPAFFPRNPRVGLGLDYEEVAFDSPLGPTPAWFIPGTALTWVVFVHGRAGTPAEGLRLASTVSGLGYPMLLIKYRDDASAPREDGIAGFGTQEWQDLQGAVRFATERGAQHIVLAGTGMGGSICLAFLERSDLAGTVVGQILDSPVTGLARVVDAQAEDRGLPAVLTSAAEAVAGWRYGIDWAATDYVARAGRLATPTLIVHGTADRTVPSADSTAFAAAAPPGLVTVELFEGAGHQQSWNTDRDRYARLVTEFLARTAP